MSSQEIRSYTLDTLQIYFAWDDDLYTYLKERGFGQSGLRRKTLPIIYSDNCESTTGVRKRSRKYVIHPKCFGKTHKELGWISTDKKTEPIIPSEKPKIAISLLDDQFLEFRIVPKVRGEGQYHIEYSSMAAFGRLYTNWAISVLRIDDFKDLVSRLQNRLSATGTEGVLILTEKKQAQRERMYYTEVPISSYKFSIGEFLYAKEFLAANGFRGILPSLTFKNEPPYLEKMEPILKVGFVQTTVEQEFEVRKPQCALKVAQPKMTMSLRGKRSKTKGLITEDREYENYFIVPAEAFTKSSQAIVNRYAAD